MSLLINRPFQGKSIPLGRLVIDQRHPLARGLVTCLVPGVMGGLDLLQNTSKINDLTIDIKLRVSVGAEGPGYATSTSVSAAYGSSTVVGLNSPLLLPTNTSALTLYWRGAREATIVGSEIWGTTFDNVLTSPPYVAMLRLFGTDMESRWNSNGTAFNSAATTPIPATGIPFSHCATFTVGGNVVTYKDGVSFSSDTFGAIAPTTSSAPFLYLATVRGNDFGSGMVSFIALAWNRALSADEITALDRDPYRLLIPVSDNVNILSPSVIADADTTTIFRIRQGWRIQP